MIDWLDNAIQRRRRGEVAAIDVELDRIERADGRLDRHAEPPPIPFPSSLDVLRPSSLEPVQHSTTPERFLMLDGLRGVAAVAVVLYHIGTANGVPWLAPRGYLAVDFFFVLSGFVIAHAYGERLTTGRMTPTAFLGVRFLRLWPTAFLGALLGLGVILFTSDGTATQASHGFALIAAAGLFLIPNMVSSELGMYPLNPPHWSLLYEIVANYVYAMVAPWLRTRTLAALVAVAGLGSIMATRQAGGGDYHGVARLVYSFFGGVLIYRWWTIPRRPTISRTALLLILASVLVAPWNAAVSRSVVDTVLTIVVLPLVVWFGASARLDAPLERIAAASGELSYPLYAIHYPIILVASASVPPIALTTALIGVALVTSRFYDRPLRRAARRLMADRRRLLEAERPAPACS